jgi:hypothetical protein
MPHTPVKLTPLTKKEESHMTWLRSNGASDDLMILSLLTAARHRAWTPLYTAQTIAKFFVWKEVENKS